MSKIYKDKSGINGTGLYTNVALNSGDFVAYIHGPMIIVREWTKTLSRKSLNWIGAGKYSWIDTKQSPFRYINHSCTPNVAIVTKRKVVAITHIPANTEITMDYSLSESDEGWSIDCDCKNKNCRKEIRSIQSLDRKTFNKSKEYIATAFKKIYQQANS